MPDYIIQVRPDGDDFWTPGSGNASYTKISFALAAYRLNVGDNLVTSTTNLRIQCYSFDVGGHEGLGDQVLISYDVRVGYLRFITDATYYIRIEAMDIFDFTLSKPNRGFYMTWDGVSSKANGIIGTTTGVTMRLNNIVIDFSDVSRSDIVGMNAFAFSGGSTYAGGTNTEYRLYGCAAIDRTRFWLGAGEPTAGFGIRSSQSPQVPPSPQTPDRLYLWNCLVFGFSTSVYWSFNSAYNKTIILAQSTLLDTYDSMPPPLSWNDATIRDYTIGYGMRGTELTMFNCYVGYMGVQYYRKQTADNASRYLRANWNARRRVGWGAYTYGYTNAAGNIAYQEPIDPLTGLPVGDRSVNAYSPTLIPGTCLVLDPSDTQLKERGENRMIDPGPPYVYLSTFINQDIQGEARPVDVWPDIGAYEAAVSTYSVDISVGPNGSTVPTGLVYVTAGGDLTIDITPDLGYEISEILLDSISQPISNPFTLTNVSENKAVSISFSKIQLLVDIGFSDGGTATPSGPLVVDYDGSVSISIIPDGGYKLFYIAVDGQQYPLSSTFVLTNIVSALNIYIGFIPDGDSRMSVRIGQESCYDVSNVSSSYELQQVLSSGQKLVLLGEGTYLLDSTIRIPSGVTVRGDGVGVTVLKYDSILSIDDMVQMESGSVLERVSLQNGTSGMVANLLTTVGDSCSVDRVYFRSGACSILNAYCKVTNCEFYLGSARLYISGDNTFVADNLFKECVSSIIVEDADYAIVRTNKIVGGLLSTYGIRLLGTSDYCLVCFNQVGDIKSNGIGIDIDLLGDSNQISNNIFFGAFGVSGKSLLVDSSVPSTNQVIANQSNGVSPSGAVISSSDLGDSAAIGNL